jgi:hypothetical protein
MHPTLLIGPADWDPARLPREAFRERLDALWRAQPSAEGVVVYGDSRHHGELAYLTNVTPKLEACVALIASNGEAALLVGGGVNMLPAAKPLTWIEKLLPLRGAGQTIAEWTRECGARRLLVLAGGAMPQPLHGAVFGVPGVECTDATAALRGMMRRKSAYELVLVKEACTSLEAAAAALIAAQRSGVGTTAAILAAEEAAWGRGAQDVRTLFSVDGGRTFEPFGVPITTTCDPLHAYLAVRQSGYWAEGFVTAMAKPLPIVEALRTALQEGLRTSRPGIRRGDLADVIAAAAGAPHPVGHPAAVSVGLTLNEADDPADMLLPGEVLSLRASRSDGTEAGIVSAMILLNDDGHEVLWSQGI